MFFREKLGITGINTVIKHCQNKWLERLQGIPENRNPKLLYQYQLNGKDVWQEDGRCSFIIVPGAAKSLLCDVHSDE
jgi:hypothetical protein